MAGVIKKTTPFSNYLHALKYQHKSIKCPCLNNNNNDKSGKSFPLISQIIADITQIFFCDDLRNLREILFEFSGIKLISLADR